MCLDKNIDNEIYFFNNTEMKNSSEEKMLGITIDNKRVKWHVNIQKNVKNLCEKASQKIWALSRLTKYLNNSKKTNL